MASTDKWVQRVGRWRDGFAQWAHVRRKDLLWLAKRRAFEAQVPELLSRHHWVFIVGCNNSGTTLVHDVLAATDSFSFMPHEGQRYTDVLRRAHRRGHERVWTEHIAELRMLEADPTDVAPRLIFDWVRELSVPLRPMILEKTTANAVRMRWLMRVFPESSYIGVVRNGYAVVEGIRRKGRQSVERGARHWNEVNSLMLEDSVHLPRFKLIRYEQFVQGSDDSLQELAAFIGLDVNTLQRGWMAVSGLEASGGVGGVRDMNKKSLDLLSQNDVAAIGREAAPMLNHFGYLA